MNFDRNKIEMVKKQYPLGTRIRLSSLCNDERDIPSGLCGTVIGVDDQPSLLMKWDNGRSLSLMPFEDSFTVIQNEQQATPDEQLYEKLCQEQAALPATQILRTRARPWSSPSRKSAPLPLPMGSIPPSLLARLPLLTQ